MRRLRPLSIEKRIIEAGLKRLRMVNIEGHRFFLFASFKTELEELLGGRPT